MRVLIKSYSVRGASISDEEGRVFIGRDCLEIVQAMHAFAPMTGCADDESYMRWTLRQLKNAGGAGGALDTSCRKLEIEGDTSQARAESFLALLGELGLAEFLSDREFLPRIRIDDGKGPVPVPAEVLAGIEAVRQGGRTNMLDTMMVIALACEAGHTVAADWIAANPAAYSAGLFQGFVADSEKKEG